MWLFCLLLAYLIVRGAEDCTSMVTGRESPRHKERMRRLNDRARAGGKPAPQSSAGRYFAGLVSDAWDSAHHRRELDRARRDERRRRKAARRHERGLVREDDRDDQHRRRFGFDASAPEPAEPDNTDTDTGPASADAAVPDSPDPDEPGESTPEVTGTGTGTEKEESPRRNVIPFPTTPKPQHTAPQRKEMPTVSTPTGEISGLNSAIAYADDLSTWCAHTGDQISSVMPSDSDAAASCEQARASLEEGGVTGQPLSDVSQVQEQMTAAVQAMNDAIAQLEAAGAAADSLKATLNEHLSVQEAYSANPEAGHREFVTAD